LLSTTPAGARSRQSGSLDGHRSGQPRAGRAARSARHRGNGLDGSILSATTDRRPALKDAGYVFSTVRIGGLEAFETDIGIPVTCGVDQCVGDALSAGGIMYGQWSIPFILDC
jgi:alpha-galactosidase/6-phospho-beta-glucosidase family protein